MKEHFESLISKKRTGTRSRFSCTTNINTLRVIVAYTLLLEKNSK